MVETYLLLKIFQIPLFKVLWKHHGLEEAIWELEDEMQKKYPEFHANKGKEF